MPEIVIRYRNKRTLDALIDFAKYFEYSIELPTKSSKKNSEKTHNVTILPADKTIDTKALERVYSVRTIDSKQLRKTAWQRNK